MRWPAVSLYFENNISVLICVYNHNRNIITLKKNIIEVQQCYSISNVASLRAADIGAIIQCT